MNRPNISNIITIAILSILILYLYQQNRQTDILINQTNKTKLKQSTSTKAIPSIINPNKPTSKSALTITSIPNKYSNLKCRKSIIDYYYLNNNNAKEVAYSKDCEEYLKNNQNHIKHLVESYISKEKECDIIENDTKKVLNKYNECQNL